MKKSEMYKLAIIAVMKSEMGDDEKLDVIDLLINDKCTAEFMEKREEKEN